MFRLPAAPTVAWLVPSKLAVADGRRGIFGAGAVILEIADLVQPLDLAHLVSQDPLHLLGQVARRNASGFGPRHLAVRPLKPSLVVQALEVLRIQLRHDAVDGRGDFRRPLNTPGELEVHRPQRLAARTAEEAERPIEARLLPKPLRVVMAEPEPEQQLASLP